jgi:hypothetical protein
MVSQQKAVLKFVPLIIETFNRDVEQSQLITTKDESPMGL